MSEYLLLITLGPIQDFIAQSRRTRDLWYGSHLLSELGRCAARTLVRAKAKLIFPALAIGDTELERCLAPLRDTGQQPLAIANKLLAEIPAGTDPAGLARMVRSDVMVFWHDDIAGAVKNNGCQDLLAGGIDDVWNDQIDTFVEFTAAWVVLSERTYKQARELLEDAIAAKKNLRDFPQWRHQRIGAPKSSLDGARDSVLKSPSERNKHLVKKYRIEAGEQLDAVGLVKRAGGEPEQFVPITNVALASWLEMAAAHESDLLKGVCRSCKEDDFPRVTRKLPCTEHFKFDASVFFPNRWATLFKELQTGDAKAASDWGRTHVKPLLAKLSDPYPYVACLVADGDSMGAALDRLDDPGQHRSFSHQLGKFAGAARGIVEAHLGSLVYSGGDDVLAFLPLPMALACADKLRLVFLDIARSISPPPQVSLSVGIGIGHVMEGMGDLLNLGREAEKLAKGSDLADEKKRRNALAIVLDKRSGGRRTWRAQWADEPAKRLVNDVALLRPASPLSSQRLPSRKVFEIANTLRAFPQEPDNGNTWRPALRREIERSLMRVEGGSEPLELSEVNLHFEDGDSYQAMRHKAFAWVNRLLVARVFAEAEPFPKSVKLEKAA